MTRMAEQPKSLSIQDIIMLQKKNPSQPSASWAGRGKALLIFVIDGDNGMNKIYYVSQMKLHVMNTQVQPSVPAQQT